MEIPLVRNVFLLMNEVIYTIDTMNSSSQFHTHLEAPSTSSSTTPIQNRVPGRAIVSRSGPFIRKPLGNGGFLSKSTSYPRGVMK